MKFIVKVKAITTKKLQYQRDSDWVSVPKGTEIIVDEDNSVALVGTDHVQVQFGDYKVLYPH